MSAILIPIISWSTNRNEEDAGIACLLLSYSMVKREIPDDNISLVSAKKMKNGHLLLVSLIEIYIIPCQQEKKGEYQ
jgi:hypothetical protein